jgi:hypothetical protein
VFGGQNSAYPACLMELASARPRVKISPSISMLPHVVQRNCAFHGHHTDRSATTLSAAAQKFAQSLMRARLFSSLAPR